MGEMRGFTPSKSSSLDWAINLISSLDPYTRKIAERKLFDAYKKGASPDSVSKFLQTLSSISIQRTADRRTKINSFSYIGRQSQLHLIPPHILRLRSPSTLPYKTQGRVERAGLPSWISRTRYKAQYEPDTNAWASTRFYSNPYPLATIEQAQEFARIREKDARKAKFRHIMSGSGVHTGEEASDKERRSEFARLNREYWEQEQYRANFQGPNIPNGWDSESAKRRQKQASSYEHDVLPDFSQKLKDLTEKYGSEQKAFDVMYKNNPLLKQIAKEMPGLTKAFMKSLPYLKIGGAAATGAFALWRFVLKEQRGFASEGIRGGRMGLDSFTAISANTALKAAGGSEKSLAPIGRWKTNIGKMMMGGSSDFLIELAKYGVNLRGSGVGGFATGDEIFKNVTGRIKQMRDSGDEERALALADIFGIDESIWKKIPQVEDGDVLKWIRKEGKESGADRAAAEEDRTLKFHETEIKFLRGWMTNLLFPKRHKTAREAYLDSMSFGMHGALESVLPEKFRIIRNISNESSSLPSQGAASQESSSPNAGAQVSFNIGTVDINANNAEQFAYELGAVASSHSKNHTLAVAFDSGLKA